MAKVQANNVSYELHSLGWKAFQNLCATIVSELWGQTFQTFFDSHDGGRDGAFHGNWETEFNETFVGSFTVQCKFTNKTNTQLKLSDLNDEIIKAKRLSSKGLSDNYFLFTNSHITGVNEELIREAFEQLDGLKQFQVYGVDWICQKIQESAKLRRLVPRVYGLGDLSQIMDQRAYRQANELLASLGDDFSKFVITNAFKESTEALNEHGFVLLLGEPACGKSTIAAALAIGALDNWKCSTIKVCSPDEFISHWNPDDPKQLFWVDDAFGATQVDWGQTLRWNYVFPHIQTAIKQGAKVIFTSRDYIYNKARESIKETALPLIKESQVVINVEQISRQEREQILYNHIKLGDQETKFKNTIKPYLPLVVDNNEFSPESARRLGNKVFTKKLVLSKVGITNFISNPMETLKETIRTIDNDSKAALALIFMNGGSLKSPVDISKREENAIELMASSSNAVRKSLKPLNESLLLSSLENGQHIWKYKHPTIRDVFASLVSEDHELMDIYLEGSSMDKLFSEVTCGEMGVKGAKVIIPVNRYDLLLTKVENYNFNSWQERMGLLAFLSRRCEKHFLNQFITRFPNFISEVKVGSYLRYNSEMDFILCLHKMNLLPELERKRVISSIKSLAVTVPDAGFLSDRVNLLLTSEEHENIVNYVRDNLLERLEDMVDDWKNSFEGDCDPEEHFEELKNALETYKSAFGEEDSIEKLELALNDIDISIEDLRSDYWPQPDNGPFYRNNSNMGLNNNEHRSIFDDVDK